MRNILLNGKFIFEPYTGMGTYTLEYLRVLAPDIAHKTTLLCPDFCYAETDDISELKGLGYSVEVMTTPKYLPKSIRVRFWEYILLPIRLFQESFSIQYMSFYPHPMCIIGEQHRYGMVIHDAIPWIDPQYKKKLSSKMYNYLTYKTVAHSHVDLFTVSETSKQEIVQHLSLQKTLQVIKNGVSHLERVPLLSKEYLKEKWNIQGPFIFYAGGYDKRKNSRLIAELFAEIASEFPGIRLYFVGNAHYTSPLYDRPKEYEQLHDRIQILGFVTREELRALYHYAQGFVMLSTHEGCNINVGLALYEGCPVLMSDIPPHQELWAQWGDLVQLGDREKVKQAFRHFLRKTQQIQIQKGIPEKDKKAFQWEEECKKFLEYFQT